VKVKEGYSAVWGVKSADAPTLCVG